MLSRRRSVALTTVQRLQEKLQIAQTNNDKKMENMVYGYLARYYDKESMLDKAIWCFEQQVAIYSDYEGGWVKVPFDTTLMSFIIMNTDQVSQHRVFCQMANVFMKREDYTAALPWLDQAMNIAKETGALDLLRVSSHNLAIVHRGLHHLDEALMYAQMLHDHSVNDVVSLLCT